MAAKQHTSPNPSREKRQRRKVVPPAALRWEGVDLAPLPTHEAWRAQSADHFNALLLARVAMQDDSDATLDRLTALGADAQSARATIAFIHTLCDAASLFRARAAVCDAVSARYMATLERMVAERPTAAAIFEEAIVQAQASA